MTVYLVDGCIEDGMQGIPITLGVFSEISIAENEIVNFIDGARYIVENGRYDVFDQNRRMIYHLGIREYKLDQVMCPSHFQ